MKPSNNETPTNEPRPEEFLVGSPESRAAARAMLEHRNSIRQTITVLIGHVEREGATADDYEKYPEKYPAKVESRKLSKDGILINIVDGANPFWSDEELHRFIAQHPISRD
jgi:hypothetical protein